MTRVRSPQREAVIRSYTYSRMLQHIQRAKLINGIMDILWSQLADNLTDNRRLMMRANSRSPQISASKLMSLTTSLSK
jgi:hypothetical protein